MRKTIVLAGMVILLAVSFSPMLSRTASAADITLTGDQVISDAQSFSGDTITLTNGNLTIASGGVLTARSTTLIMDGNVSGMYHIEVAEGATLIASGCTIKSTSNTFRFQFWVRPNSTFNMDNCVLRDCGLPSGIPAYALYIQSSSASITNSTISNGCGGILVDNGSAPFIYKNTITNNAWAGVAVINGARPVIDRNTISSNMLNPQVNPGGGVVSSGGSPFISNNTISANVDPSAGWTTGINLQGADCYPNVTDNRITGHQDAGQADEWGWAIFQNGPSSYVAGNDITGNCDGVFIRGGTWVFENNRVTDNKRPGFANGGYAYATGASSVSRNNLFSGNRLGPLLIDSSNAFFYDDRILNHSEAGIVGDAQTSPFGGNFVNCTLSGNRKDLQFNRAIMTQHVGGICTLLNTSYDNKTVEITDDLAQIIVRWYLHVKVVYESTGAAVEGASIKCKDRLGGTQLLILSGPDGWSPWMVLQEKTFGNKSEYNVTLAPYNISVQKGSGFNWTVLKLDQSSEFTFPLDDIVPWLKVDSPQDNDVVNRTTVEFGGTVETPYVAVSVGGVPASVSPDGTWTAKVPLPAEGKNSITASAQDRGRNFWNQTVTVVRDTTAPAITLTSPEDNSLTNRTTVTVSGRVSDISGHTFVGGAEVPVAPDGTFSAQVPVDEGLNTIKVECADAVWNTATVAVRVERDTAAPSLIVSEPGDGFATNASSVTVKGTTDAGSSLTVNDRPVPLTGERFSATVELVEDQNIIVVASSDAAGNLRRVELRVVRDSTPPKLTLSSPASGAIVKDPLVTVRGSTEEGALVKVNGGGVSFDGRNFMAEVRLTSEGENTIVLDAYDALKNHVQMVLKVYLDTLAPDLRITSPVPNFLTSQAQFELRGRTEPLANVTVDGEPVPVDGNGLFSVKLPLPADGSYTFDIISTDIAGNFNEEFLTVVKDTVVRFNISSPVNGLKTKLKTLSVTGDVEIGSTVSVNGNSVSVRPDGTFIAEVILNDGQNTIIVQLRDKAGNLATKEITVTKTKQAPPPPGTIPGFEALVAVAALAAVAAAFRSRRDRR